MITGRKSWTDCSGTPRQISIPVIISRVWRANTQNYPTGWVFEDSHGISQIEFLIDNARRIDLNSIKCQLLLLVIEKSTRLRVVRQIPKGKERERDCTQS